MKDCNGVEIKVDQTATHVGDGLNKGKVGKVQEINEEAWLGGWNERGPSAMLVGDGWPAGGWGAWLKSSEIAVVEEKGK